MTFEDALEGTGKGLERLRDLEGQGVDVVAVHGVEDGDVGVEKAEEIEEPRIGEPEDGDEIKFEEAIGAMRRKPAMRPSEAEVRAHRATHLPFRDWREVCVAGSTNG